MCVRGYDIDVGLIVCSEVPESMVRIHGAVTGHGPDTALANLASAGQPSHPRQPRRLGRPHAQHKTDGPPPPGPGTAVAVVGCYLRVVPLPSPPPLLSSPFLSSPPHTAARCSGPVTPTPLVYFASGHPSAPGAGGRLAVAEKCLEEPGLLCLCYSCRIARLASCWLRRVEEG